MKYVNCYKFIQKENSKSKYAYYGKIRIDDIILFTKDIRTISPTIKVRKIENKQY